MPDCAKLEGMPAWFSEFNTELIACRRCPRLVEHCTAIAREKRRAYRDWEYWGKPVPGFGDPKARILLLGLAPGAHGSNRTGRMFTGDSSGNFLYPVLYATGFASQPNATDVADGLKLKDAYITATVRCAPPDNKPTPDEIANCSDFLDRELAQLKNVRVVVALGRIGFEAYLNHLKRRGMLESKKEYVFGHGAHYRMPDDRWLLASYHPSNQNTQTGKLTEKMFREIFVRAKELAQDQAARRHSSSEMDCTSPGGRSQRRFSSLAPAKNTSTQASKPGPPRRSRTRSVPHTISDAGRGRCGGEIRLRAVVPSGHSGSHSWKQQPPTANRDAGRRQYSHPGSVRPRTGQGPGGTRSSVSANAPTTGSSGEAGVPPWWKTGELRRSGCAHQPPPASARSRNLRHEGLVLVCRRIRAKGA